MQITVTITNHSLIVFHFSGIRVMCEKMRAMFTA